MRESDALLTVICTTYNHKDYIKETLDGILMQKTAFKFKVIIHDDASTDGTSDVVRKYAEQYPDIIEAIIQPENLYQQNKSLFPYLSALVEGKYVALCEGDDYWIDENKLQKQIDYMEAHPDCTLCKHNSYLLDDQHRTGPYAGTVMPTNFSEGDRIDLRQYLKWYVSNIRFGQTASFVLRMDIWKNKPSWLMRFSFGDLFTDLFAADKGYIHYIPDIMAVYRVNNHTSWTGRLWMGEMTPQKRYETIRDSYNEVLDAFEYFNMETKYKYDNEIKVVKRHWWDKHIRELYQNSLLQSLAPRLRPLVSVILRGLASENEIKRSLECLKLQSLQDIEIIVLLDEDLKNKLVTFDAGERIIQYVVRQNKKDINSCIALAKGEYIMFMNSGDVIRQNTLEKSYEYAVSQKAEVLQPTGIGILDYMDTVNTNVIHYKTLEEREADQGIVQLSGNIIERLTRLIKQRNCWNAEGVLFLRDFLLENRVKFSIFEENDYVFMFLCICRAERYVQLPFMGYITFKDIFAAKQLDRKTMKKARRILERVLMKQGEFHVDLDLEKSIMQSYAERFKNDDGM